MIDAVRADVRYGARKLARDPWFTLVAVAVLALGIGGTTAVFSFVDALLLKELPVRDSSRLVWIGAPGATGDRVSSFSYPELEELRRGPSGLADLAAFGFRTFRLGTAGGAPVVGAVASERYFSVLGVRPARGRLFVPGDAAPGAEPVAVLSHDLWRRRFGSDPGVVGRTIQVNGRAVTVAGVAPPGFGGTVSLVGLDLWIPLSAYPALFPGESLDSRGHRWLQLFGRMPPGADRRVVAERLTALARGSAPADAELGLAPRRIFVEPLGGLNGSGRRGATGVGGLLLATAGLVLAIASVNVAGMLLARNALRAPEIGVRLALGAGPGRLARQLLAESVLLWLAGALCGVLLAMPLLAALPRVLPVSESFPARLGLDLGVDARVLGFSLAVALATGVGFGLLPALQASGLPVVPALRRQMDPARGSGGRRAGIAAQVALSFLLLASAGLLLRAMLHLSRADPGLDPDGVTAVRFDLPAPGMDVAGARRFQEQLLARVQARPDVEAASLASEVPVVGGRRTTRVAVDDARGPLRGFEMETEYAAVSPDHFRALRIPLARGRAFTAADRAESPGVAIVSESLARRHWPGQDAVGKVLRRGGRPLQVVGVARDVSGEIGGAGAAPAFYVPLAQEPGGDGAALLVRWRGRPGSIAEDVRALAPAMPPPSSVPLRDLMLAAMPQRLLAPLLGAFGALGLLLATVGVYGLVAHFAAHRTRELGVCMALGARPGHVVRRVIGQAASVVAAGIVVGTALSLLATRALAPLLAGGGAFDPVTYAAVVLVLLAASLLASYLPARRATRIDPAVALRSE